MILYHYTSNETLLSILQNKKIYLSDLSLSNDSTEGAYTFELVKEVLQEEQVWSPTGFDIDILGEQTTALGFCLSSEGDMLSQWRAYASDGQGVSIGFNKDIIVQLIEDLNQSAVIFKLVEIEYNKSNQKRHIKTILYNSIEKFKKNNQNHDIYKTTEEYALSGELENIVNEFIDLLFPAIIDQYNFKSPFFSEEKEWRLIQNIARGTLREKLDHLGFRAEKNKIVPYRNFPDFELPTDAISEIVLGPQNTTPDKIMRAMLDNNDFDNCEIKRSGGSYQ